MRKVMSIVLAIAVILFWGRYRKAYASEVNPLGGLEPVVYNEDPTPMGPASGPTPIDDMPGDKPVIGGKEHKPELTGKEKAMAVQAEKGSKELPNGMILAPRSDKPGYEVLRPGDVQHHGKKAPAPPSGPGPTGSGGREPIMIK